jgi:hypothetical protein
MRLLRFFVLSLMTAIPLVFLGQAQLQSPFVVKLKYAKIDLPRSSSDTCLVVFPDGKFHLEQGSVWPVSKAQVFEDSLTHDSLNSLTTLLAAEELKSLQTTREQVAIAEGEVVWVLIPRGEALQMLTFAGVVGSATQHVRKLPTALEPLLNWFHTTIEGVKQQKLRALKGAKATNCGLTIAVKAR